MADDGRRQDPGMKPKWDFSHLELGGIEGRIRADEYVSGEELAAALEKYGSRPLPPEVQAYLCGMLREEIKAPPGKKAVPEIMRHQYEMIVRDRYHHYQSFFKKLKRRRGKIVCNGERVTPAQAAARVVAERYGRGWKSWRDVQNIASSSK